MKKIIFSLFGFLTGYLSAFCQAPTFTGKPVAEIFADFHLNLDDTSKTTGFGLTRAYLGYIFMPGGKFTGSVILNIGNPDDLAPGSEPRRYAFFREASLAYNTEKLRISFGITGTHLFDFQQKFWGKRYVANTYQSINGYGYVADLGVVADYYLSDITRIDISVTNGEGYSNIQLDNSIKTSAGLTIAPQAGLAARIYGEIIRVRGIWQPLFIGFIGYRNKFFTAGAEGTYKSNLDLNRGHHAWGISATGSLLVARKTEAFIRYDYSTSVRVHGEIFGWNYLNDGSFLVTGLQYTFNDYVKAAVDYQGRFPAAGVKQVSDAILLNAVFKF